LRGKFNLLVLSLLIISIGLITVFLFQKEKDALILKSLTNIKKVVQLEGLKIDGLILEAMNDIKILSKSPAIQGVIRARQSKNGIDPLHNTTEEVLLSRLTSVFKAFIGEKANYFQIRFIGRSENGLEIVRVEKDGDLIKVTPKSNLQEKRATSYFKKTIKLSPGQNHLSPINLNKEKGAVQVPNIATIRVATPVYDFGGDVFGLVVINLSLNSTLNSLIEGDRGMYVFNDSGDFLAHQDSRFNFGFDLGKRHTVVDSFPGMVPFWGEVDANDEFSAIDSNSEESLVYIWKQNIGPKEFGQYIGMMKRQRVSSITGELVSVFSETLVLMIGLLVFSFMVGVYFSRRLTKPLEQLTEAATQFAKGSLDKEVVIKTLDEIGELGRAFNAMVAERNKREVEIKKLSNAVQQSPATIIITDIEGNIEYANPSFYKLNGFAKSDEIIGMNMNVLNSGEHPQDFIENFWETILDGRIWRGEWCNRKKNGELYWARAVTSPIKDKSGNITHFVEVKEDMTEQKKKSEELRESKLKLEKSNQALREFAAYASHDLGEPLRKVKMFGGWLQKESCYFEEKQKDYLRRMINATDRMELLIKQLLEYSKVSFERLRLESCDLNEILSCVIDDLEIRLTETGGIIEYGELPSLLADKMLITQLFQNLIGNSLKYVRDGVTPKIKIRCHVEGNLYKITLEDNGIGMDEKNLERIFKPFDRLHGRSEYEGSGIGLAICRKVVEVHRGSITAQSELGKGSTFIIKLPVQDSDLSIANLAPTGDRSGRHRLLL